MYVTRCYDVVTYINNTTFTRTTALKRENLLLRTMVSCGRDSILSLVVLLLFCATWSLYLLTLRLHIPDSTSPVTSSTIKSLVDSALRRRSTSSPSRILVTGGSGFLGSHLVDRLLLEGHFVTVVDNLESSQ